MACAQLAGPHQVLHAVGQLQQAQRVGEMAAALADDLGEVLLRIAVAVHQQLVALALLDRVQVLALDVLDDGDLDRFLVRERAHDDRHVVQIGELRRAPAALAGDDLIGVAGRRPDDQRLHQTTLADRGGKLLELRLGEVAARVEPAGLERGERYAPQILLGADAGLVRCDRRSATQVPCPSLVFCAPAAMAASSPSDSPVDDHAARIRRSRSITSEAS